MARCTLRRNESATERRAELREESRKNDRWFIHTWSPLAQGVLWTGVLGVCAGVVYWSYKTQRTS